MQHPDLLAVAVERVPQVRGTFSDVDPLEALDELNRLLDITDSDTVNTSMRLPVALRDAAALAVATFGAAPSTTTLTATALRHALETVAMDTALQLHHAQHPDTAPTLTEVALALAVQDGSPLADQPELIARAAADIVTRHPDAGADDVLLWAEAHLAATT